MRQLLIFAYMFTYCSVGLCQTIIEGHVLSVDGAPINGASILVIDPGTDHVLGYDISESDGSYTIVLENEIKEVQISLRSMGYKTINRTIGNVSRTLDFTMEEKITQLKEVFVKSDPIIQKGDTIEYSVPAFANQADRTLADVLKNMPGIEVQENGRILYQGTPINTYYIEGLDLLEGRYHLANSNLPHREVSSVQVLENHQPIKILDSLVFSDRAALNVKLKNSHTFTGQAELGSGAAPILWDINVIPMLFSGQRQLIGTYQTNNIGDDLAAQLEKLTPREERGALVQGEEKRDWLSIQKLGTPNFSQYRWLDNNVHLFTTDHLEKIKNEYQLRLNISYLNDHQQQKGTSHTQYYTGYDTIALFENKFNRLYTNSLKTNLTLQKNTKNNYLKNSLQFQGFWDGQRGTVQSDETIVQQLDNHYFKGSNDLNAMFQIGKRIAQLNSSVGFSRTPQSLWVDPGQFVDLLNQGQAYGELTQHIDLNTFYTHNSIGMTLGWKSFSFSPKVGFLYEKQRLESQIVTSDPVPGFGNDLDWSRSEVYYDLQTQYHKGKLRLGLQLPLHLHRYRIADRPLQREQHLDRLTFEPRLTLNYELNNFWHLGTSAGTNNVFGAIDRMHYNYIVQNYRSVQRMDTPLPEIQNTDHSISVGYRNPVKALFFNLIHRYEVSNHNLMYTTQIMEQGVTDRTAMALDNKRRSRNLLTGLSKYYSSFNTKFSLNTGYAMVDFKQILNSGTVDISNRTWQLNGNIDVEFTPWLHWELGSVLQFSKSEIQDRDNRNITQQLHKLNIGVHPGKNQYLALKTEYLENRLFSGNTQNVFVDMLYRRTWKKKNMDFELHWTNLFNTSKYRRVTMEDFIYVESNFDLRPSQILFKIRVSL